MSEKNKLAEKLLYAPKNGYDRLSAEDEKAMEAYCEDYKKFLNNGKTERLCVEYCIELAEKKGFKAYEAGMKLSAGDKVYFNNRGKGIMLAVIGSEDERPREHRRGAHRLPAPRLKAPPARPGGRDGLLQDPPLRRHPQVPVGDDPPRATRRRRAARRFARRPHRRQGGRSPVHHQRPFTAPWPRAGQKAAQRGHPERELERAARRKAV